MYAFYPPKIFLIKGLILIFLFTYLKPKQFHKGIDEVLKSVPKKYRAWHGEYEHPARDDRTTGL